MFFTTVLVSPSDFHLPHSPDYRNPLFTLSMILTTRWRHATQATVKHGLRISHTVLLHTTLTGSETFGECLSLSTNLIGRWSEAAFS